MKSILTMAWTAEDPSAFDLAAKLARTFGARLVLQPTQEQLSMTITKLAESESRTRAVVNAMEDGMFIVDDTGAITEWNPAALRILGLPENATTAEVTTIARAAFDESGRELTLERDAADPAQLAVGDVPDGPVDISQPGHPQAPPGPKPS